MQLSVKQLACKRKDIVIFENISFSLQSGKGLLVKGANGSGKTTLLKVIMGMLPKAKGTILLDGADPELRFQQNIHYIGHANGIKHTLTVRENLQFFSSFFSEFKSNEKTYQDILQDLKLEGLADIPAGYLSAGQKRKLGLARLYFGNRPLWLLDEPTVSLDQSSQTILIGLLNRHLQNGGMPILVTHIALQGLDLSGELVLQSTSQPETYLSNDTTDMMYEAL
ncbi:MAG: heme ABC exporter ATP-binding protein CcmA [Pseudomonadota bacterium]